MIIFWSVAVVMLLIALAIVLIPLFRRYHQHHQPERVNLNIRIHKEHLQDLQGALAAGELDQKDYDNAVRELELQLLSDVKSTEEHQDKKKEDSGKPVLTAVSIVVLLPLFVASYYLVQGESELIGAQPDPHQQQLSSSEMHSVEEMVEGLKNRLQNQPDDADGWSMLGRSYMVMNRYDDAVAAYRKAHELVGDEAEILADLAEALIVANGNSFTRESLDNIALALQKNPDEPKALWMAGYAAMEQGEPRKTVQYWEKLLKQLPPDSQEASSLQENIARVKQGAAMAVASGEDTGITNDAVDVAEPAPAESSTSIEVQVSLDAALADKADADDTVFVFARAAEGPRMPLAIVRKQVKELPLKVTLDDSMAMSPQMTLSQFKDIVVGARISKSGNAMPQSGDLQGTSKVVSADEVTGIKIIINEAVP